MHDCLLFGAGYNGDKRDAESAVSPLKAISKPEPTSGPSDMICYKSAGFINFIIHKFEDGEHTYLYATHEIEPSDDEIRKAIFKFRPKPFIE